MSVIPILSVVIATHNRSEYAIQAVKSALNIKSEFIEIILHDTSTDGKLPLNIEPQLHDCRLRYYHCDIRLSMTENHHRALSMAKGEYICMIGDDDTISFEILEAVQWAIKNNIEAISSKVIASYYWPDFRSKTFGAGHANRLYLSSFTSTITTSDCLCSLKSSLEAACQGTDGLPKIYHGIVKRSVMERIKSKAGSYFFGVSPDISGAIGVALMTNSFSQFDYPLTIAGGAGNSNSGRSAMNSHRGKLEDDPHIKPYKNLIWPELIPRFFSVETVWGQAAYETLIKLDSEKIKSFNFIYLYSVCIINHPTYYKEIFKALNYYKNNYEINTSNSFYKFFQSVIGLSFKKIIRLGRRALKPTAAGGLMFIPCVENIFDAGEALKIYLNKKNVSLKIMLKS